MLIEGLTMEEFERGLEKTRTLVVPFGTVEAHGVHLPLGTDTLIIQEVVRRVSERTTVFVAPPVHYGQCTSTVQHPGTISISAETLRRIITDIVRDGFRKGLRRFVLVSGHGGGIHTSAMREAAELLTEELKGVVIAAFAIYDILPPEAMDLADTKNDSHAGELETSLILSLSEELVKGRGREGYPDLPKPIVAADKRRYWPGAVWGNPAKASKSKGDRLFDIMEKSLLDLVRRIEEFGG